MSTALPLNARINFPHLSLYLVVNKLSGTNLTESCLSSKNLVWSISMIALPLSVVSYSLPSNLTQMYPGEFCSIKILLIYPFC